MIKQNGFDIILSGDEGYEKLCAEIYYDGNFVAIISQEDDSIGPIIEVVSSADAKDKWSFDCFEFMKIIRQAYDLL